jgi:hypothetical protein
VLGFIALMAGLVAELVMRAGFEFNAGRYWTEARRVNFERGGAIIAQRSLPIDEVQPNMPAKSVDEALRR